MFCSQTFTLDFCLDFNCPALFVHDQYFSLQISASTIKIWNLKNWKNNFNVYQAWPGRDRDLFFFRQIWFSWNRTLPRAIKIWSASLNVHPRFKPRLLYNIIYTLYVYHSIWTALSRTNLLISYRNSRRNGFARALDIRFFYLRSLLEN